MSQANEAMVRSMYAAFSELTQQADKASYVRTYYEPEAVYEAVEEAAPVTGHDDLVRWHERWFEAWDEFHAHPDEVITEGETVFSTVHVRGRGAGSGTEVVQRFFHVIDVQNGRI